MSAQIKDGGLAFPRTYNGDGHNGMTLRDYFAAKAMQTFMSGAVLPPGYDAHEELALVAFRAYEAADAMLADREVKS